MDAPRPNNKVKNKEEYQFIPRQTPTSSTPESQVTSHDDISERESSCLDCGLFINAEDGGDKGCVYRLCSWFKKWFKEGSIQKWAPGKSFDQQIQEITTESLDSLSLYDRSSHWACPCLKFCRKLCQKLCRKRWIQIRHVRAMEDVWSREVNFDSLPRMNTKEEEECKDTRDRNKEKNEHDKNDKTVTTLLTCPIERSMMPDSNTHSQDTYNRDSASAYISLSSFDGESGNVNTMVCSKDMNQENNIDAGTVYFSFSSSDEGSPEQ